MELGKLFDLCNEVRSAGRARRCDRGIVGVPWVFIEPAA